MEDEIVSITKGYIDFLEKDEGTDRENKKISNEIIFVEEGKIIFSITDGKHIIFGLKIKRLSTHF